MEIRLDEFIALLENEREKSGEENPFVYVGTQNHKGSTFGRFNVSCEESLGDRMRKDIFITSKVQ